MPGVGVVRRLAGAVDVLQPEHRQGDREAGRPVAEHELLGELRRAVDARRVRVRRRGVGRERRGRLSGGVDVRPLRRRELGVGAGRRLEHAAVGGSPGTLAVDRAARREHDVAGQRVVADERVEHRGGADHVGGGVPGGLGQRLSGPGLGGEMDHQLGAEPVEQGVPQRRVGHIADDQLHALGQRSGTGPVGVDLREQVVGRHDGQPELEQVRRERAADEAGTSCDQHRWLQPGRRAQLTHLHQLGTQGSDSPAPRVAAPAQPNATQAYLSIRSATTVALYRRRRFEQCSTAPA